MINGLIGAIILLTPSNDLGLNYRKIDIMYIFFYLDGVSFGTFSN